MPNYCSLISEAGTAPDPDRMEMFKPYFVYPADSGPISAVLKVPSECFFIKNSTTGAPPDGPCEPELLQYTISVDKEQGCAPGDYIILSVTLPYHEDESGDYLVVYVVDDSDSGTVKSGSKTKKAVS